MKEFFKTGKIVLAIAITAAFVIGIIYVVFFR